MDKGNKAMFSGWELESICAKHIEINNFLLIMTTPMKTIQKQITST